jgi:hypothetical protein
MAQPPITQPKAGSEIRAEFYKIMTMAEDGCKWFMLEWCAAVDDENGRGNVIVL